MAIKHIIWSNIGLNLDDWRDDLVEHYPYTNPTDEQLWEEMYRVNDQYLDDERTNLDITLHRPILVLTQLGRWDGKHNGYKIIDSGNIADCLQTDCDYAQWYLNENGDLWCDAMHHDGNNVYLYRAVKPDTTDEELDTLVSVWLMHGGCSDNLDECTYRLGDEIAKVYGWTI